MNLTYLEAAFLNRAIGIALMSGRTADDEITDVVHKKVADELIKRGSTGADTSESANGSMNFTLEELRCLYQMISTALLTGKIQFDKTTEEVHRKVAEELCRKSKYLGVTIEQLLEPEDGSDQEKEVG